MLLVHQKKEDNGRWEVATTWLPFFLAADQGLLREIDKVMTKEFKGTTWVPEQSESILRTMHDRVVELILKKYPILGLREHLQTLAEIDPEKRA